MSWLRFCLLTLVLAQRARPSEEDSDDNGSVEMENTATGRGSGMDDDGLSGPIENTATGRGGGLTTTEESTEATDDDGTTASLTMGPIMAGIGFCICFAAVVIYLCRKEYVEKCEEEEKKASEQKEHQEEMKKHVVGMQWRALRGDARMREEADLTSAVVAGLITEGDVLEQIGGPMWVGQHERIKIRTSGAVPKEGWVTPDARPHGPLFFVAQKDYEAVWV